MKWVARVVLLGVCIMAVRVGFSFGPVYGIAALLVSLVAFQRLFKQQRQKALLKEAVQWAEKRHGTADIEQRNRCESELRIIFQKLRDRYGMPIEDIRRYILEMRQARR